MSGLITVIVPVYNADKYLSDCLESLTGQTYEKLEILLINDGSRDNSAAVCDSWVAKDTRISVYHQENQGVSQARNLGLEKARGEYIAFVDADDWIEPDMLEKLLHCMERDGSELALCGFREVGERERQFERETGAPDVQQGAWAGADAAAVQDARTYAGEYLLNGNTHCWAALFSAELVKTARFAQGLTIGEDLLFLVDLLPGLKRVSILPDRAYCYYNNEKGAMSAAFRPSYMDQITCWERTRERIAALYPEYVPKTDTCLFQAVLLTVGKLAALPPKEWKSTCSGYIRMCTQAAGAAWKRLAGNRKRLLSGGYRIKGLLFCHAPAVYLRLYHLRTRVGKD